MQNACMHAFMTQPCSIYSYIANTNKMLWKNQGSSKCTFRHPCMGFTGGKNEICSSEVLSRISTASSVPRGSLHTRKGFTAIRLRYFSIR